MFTLTRIAGVLLRSALFAMVVLSFASSSLIQAAVVNARSASIADVIAAVGLAKEGDTVILPAATVTWSATLNITKNITLQGAGEAETIITAGTKNLINVDLNHDSPAALPYSFRLSGMTFKGGAVATSPALITITGKSNYVATPTVANPAPYILGCVSRVRVDHVTFDSVPGICLIPDSVLGVGDHLTFNQSTAKSYPIKVYHHNWTPHVYKETPDAPGVSMKTLAKAGFGSWADDNYFGSDKFWFFEDSYFNISPNVCDTEGGARVVWRHNTIIGGAQAGHGMEGSPRTGHRATEIYNNYVNLAGSGGWPVSIRSGTGLWFNNKVANCGYGLKFYTFRYTRVEQNWGGVNGESRYDDNAATGGPNNDGVLYDGQVTGGITSVNGWPIASLEDTNQANFSLITPGDGSIYTVENLSDPSKQAIQNGGVDKVDRGWKYFQSGILTVSGKRLNLLYEATLYPDGSRPYSAVWHVGDHYQVRKVRAAYGQPGTGRGRLLNVVSGSSVGQFYNTYFYPATSGAKASYPQAGWPREPLYSWNNNDARNGLLNFGAQGNPSLLPNRDYFNKGARTPLVTQKVGYPEQDYAGATNNHPAIGPSGDIPYEPFTYPHPLQSGPAPTAPIPQAPSNLRVAPGS